MTYPVNLLKIFLVWVKKRSKDVIVIFFGKNAVVVLKKYGKVVTTFAKNHLP